MNIDTSLLNRLEFIEFKQHVLFLKQPNHKVKVFSDLSLDEYLKIKDYVNKFEELLKLNNSLSFKDFTNGLYDICPRIKTYSESSVLIAKILMGYNNYDLLFSHNN